MAESKGRVWKKIAFFYGLTTLLSTPFNLFMIFAGDILSGGMLYMAGLMWSPAVAAIVTKKLFGESLRDLGWGWGRPLHQ